MKIAYLDCSAGISGDMCLGALVDAGLPLEEIEEGLRDLPVEGYGLEARKVKRAGISSTKVDVVLRCGAGEQRSRRWADIRDIVKRSSLPPRIRERGLRIFKGLFEAEGKVHGVAYRRAHLHELGAVDCIVDIFGALIGIDRLGVGKVRSSAVNLGSGSVRTEHGTLPVPAPATAEILKGVPVYSSGIPFELTTPTGAAILREIAEGFGEMPSMSVKTIGYGAGRKDLRELPNALRIFVGEEAERSGPRRPGVTVIETNIDDMNPQIYEYVIERLFEAGALDVFLTPVIMKKGRPGVVLTVLCEEEKRERIAGIVLSETTSIGLRFYEASRMVLDREIRQVNTEFGKMKVKMAKLGAKAVKCAPEYEDCRKIARELRVPLREVLRRAIKDGE